MSEGKARAVGINHVALEVADIDAALDVDGPGGVLHAKAVVSDDEAVFVTSANLTEAALDRNIEVGLLVRDRALAATVLSHFQGLIDHGLLRALSDG